MSEEMTKSLPKLLSFEHKCKQTKCKQMSEEFENMKKFILYSNQLNIYYLNNVKNVDNCSTGDQTFFTQEKQSLIKSIESEVNKINETLHLILKDKHSAKNNVLKQKPVKTQCDLCRKHLSSKLLTTHLTEHLNDICDRKSLKDNSLNIRIKGHSNEQSDQHLGSLFSAVKEELETDSDDNYSNFSADSNRMDSDFSDEEISERESKKTVRNQIQSQRTNSSVKRMRKSTENCSNICEECGKGCKNSRHLTHHLSRIHKISKKTSNNCHLCDFGKVSIEELKTHFSTEHNLSVNKWNFHCVWPECGQVFRFRTALDKHFRTHTGDLLYKCSWPDCTVQFNKQWRITEHMRTHTGEKPFVCHWPGCDKAFGNRGSYRVHVLSHNKERHVCYYPACDKSYAFESALKEHVLKTHRKDEKPFVCTVDGCGRAFATKANLNMHKIIHTDRPRYRCTHEGCDRSFLEEKSLEKHLEKPHEEMRHSSNGKQRYKNYKCDWPGCDYQASISSNLKTHRMRIHTGEKPIKCEHPGCQFAFVRKYELTVHMLKHTGEMPYPCSYPNCGKRYKSQRSLDIHINKTHSL